MFSGIYHPLDANSRANKRIEEKNMNPRNLTRETIEQLNDIEPYCFETDREEQWFNIGLQYGLDVADSDPISPWINVDEDLPCNHEELKPNSYATYKVIVLLNDGRIRETYMFFDKWMQYGKKITHWMPFIEPSKE